LHNRLIVILILYLASGDLRDIVLSINAIPADYPGRISITINDANPYITARNLLIILAIAGVKSTSLAVDIALHLWYSAFIPIAYNDRIIAFLLPTLATVKEHRLDWSSGGLRVIADLTPATKGLLMSYYYQEKLPDIKVATENYLKVMSVHLAWLYQREHGRYAEKARNRFSPNRVDERELYLCKLKPGHRLAINSHRKNGILLPFGAVKSPFDTPNITLFTQEGEWLQEDLASPLAGWEWVLSGLWSLFAYGHI
jgi:hypothetical protein